MDSIRCGGAITTPILPDEFGCSAITTPRLRDGLRGPVGPPGVQEALHQWPTLAALAAPTLAALAALALYQWPANGGLGGANFGNFGLSSGFGNLSSASTQVLLSVSVVVASPSLLVMGSSEVRSAPVISDDSASSGCHNFHKRLGMDPPTHLHV